MSERGRPGNTIEPLIRVHELDEFFRDLRRAVTELEEAYQNDDLATISAKSEYESRFGTALIGTYRDLAKRPPLADPGRRRQQTVYALLGQMRDELFGIDHWYHAEIEPIAIEATETSEDEPQPDATATSETQPVQPESQIGPNFQYRISAELPEPVILRFDQLVSARNWRIGFTFDSQLAMDELAAEMAKQSVQHLARDLHDLGKMLPRLLRSRHSEFPPLVPPRSGRALEQLVADIVNENAPYASLSRLSEDYSQKTDLRVKYPDLERNRGARVQVTLGANRDSHISKVSGIVNAEHFVIVSPWTLANAVPHLDDQEGQDEHSKVEFDDDLICRFWASIQGQPSDIQSLSYTLRKIFESAIKKSHLDPRGPMAFVPPAVREFVRVFVRSESFRSTRALRKWLAFEGRYVRTGDGRLSARRKFTEPPNPAVEQFYQTHPVGSIVNGKVTTVTPHEARVDLGDRIHGRVPKNEISWRSMRADPGHFLEPDQWSDFVVMESVDPTLASIVELSLKRLKPDPWQSESLQAYKIGEVYTGKIQQQKNYGIFVELDPDFVGLLHETQLPQADREKLPQLYTSKATLRVRILNIDAESRRISLQPADSPDGNAADPTE